MSPAFDRILHNTLGVKTFETLRVFTVWQTTSFLFDVQNAVSFQKSSENKIINKRKKMEPKRTNSRQFQFLSFSKDILQ